MAYDLVKGIWLFIRSNKFKISRRGFISRLLRIENNPSLYSLSETFAFYGIETAPLKIESPDLEKLKTPFLALLKNRKFLVVRKANAKLQNFSFLGWKRLDEKRFVQEWSGVIFIARSGQQIKEEDYRANRIREQLEKIIYGIMPFIPVLLLFLPNNSHLDLKYLLLYILSYIGFITAIAIVSKEFSVSSNFIQRICNFGAKINCDAVIFSKTSRFLKWTSLSELSCIYFVTSLTSLGFLFLSFNAYNLIFFIELLSWLSLVAVAYSLYIQLFRVRKICILCILIILVLSCQFIIVLNLKNIGIEHNFLNWLLFALIVVFSFFVSGLIREKFKSKVELINQRRILSSIRQKPLILSAILQEAKMINQPLQPDELTFHKDAKHHLLTIVIHPYCHFCEEEIRVFNQTIKKYSEQLQVNYVFLADEFESNPINFICKTLLYHASSTDLFGFNESLINWFQLKDIKKWSEKYAIQSIPAKYDDVLRRQIIWCKSNQITSTPTLIYNNRRVPSYLTINDLNILFSAT